MGGPRPGCMEVLYAQRTEDLLERLAGELAQSPPRDPLDRVCVIVQNRGMARWLELHLAARLGVWANPWFPFPRTFVDWLWRRVCGVSGVYGGDPVDEEILRWAVAAALPDLLDQPAFEPLRSWLGPDRDPARLLALAGQVGSVFDRYLLHAPDLLLAWETGDAHGANAALGVDAAGDTGDTAAWQSALWRAVLERLGREQRHAARRTRDLCQALRDGPAPALRGLGRVSVFGVSALSPTYVGIFRELARHVPVTAYTLAPSARDGARVVEAARAAGWCAEERIGPTADEVAARLFALGEVHPLIAGQAGAVRSFQALACAAGAETTSLSVAVERPAASASLLACLQADIEAGGLPAPCPERVTRVRLGDDMSIGLHSCHGPLREAEVARDQILAAFDAIPDLAPHDVVVMVPDVERYAPYLEAVFGVGQDEGTAIPHRVADRPTVASRPGTEAFQRALGVLRGRMTAPEVLDLLAMEPVRRAHGLDQNDIETLVGWVEQSGIRWGLDAEHRAAVGQPGLAANTWRWGLGRLVVGWAAPGDGRARLEDTLPFAPAGSEPHALGALLDFLALLERWRAELGPALWPLERWAERLPAMCAELLGPRPEAEDDRVFVEGALGRLASLARDAGFELPLPLDAAAEVVGGALEADPPPRGFLEGAVTVCALVPMRAIPFRVVVLVGMNDGVFPRTDRPPDFDLVARRRRLGDTTRRETDRLLFLEAVLCARDRLVISWTGRDPSTDAQVPPSVVVTELLDVLVAMGQGEVAAKDLVVYHALHPFSPKYFPRQPDGDRRWFSYSRDRAALAATTSSPAARRGRSPLVSSPLDPVFRADERDGTAGVSVDALARFLEAPARRLVRDRLDIVLPEEAAPLGEREPMALSHLDRWAVGDAMVRALLDGAAPDEAVAIALAEGRLPLGTPGALAVAPIRDAAERIVALAGQLRRGAPPRTAAIDLAACGGRARLTGALDGLLGAGRLEAGFGRLDDRRKLRMWIRHLVLNVAVQEEMVRETAPVTWAVGRSAKSSRELAAVRMAPVAAARAHLDLVLGLWFDAETCVPPFYPCAAREFTARLAMEARKGTSEPESTLIALHRASDAFGSGRAEADAGGQSWAPRDLDDGYLALALGDALPWDADGDPLDEALVARFQATARAVYEPLDAAIEERFDEDACEWLAAGAPNPGFGAAS